MAQETVQTCFLLNHSCHDSRGRFVITLFGAGSEGIPARITVDSFRPLFFVPRSTPPAETGTAEERRALPLSLLTGGGPVDCCYFRSYKDFSESGRNLRSRGYALFESDVHPVDRYLMERSVTGGFDASGEWRREGNLLCCRNPKIRGAPVKPVLRVLSLDIETDGESGMILSIACCGEREAVFIQGEIATSPPIVPCRNESDLLQRFFGHLQREDPDIIIGWNIVGFDLETIQERCGRLGIPFQVGKAMGARIVETGRDERKTARIPGRVVLDVPTMLRVSYHAFEEYSLEYVATALLGRGKSIKLEGKEKVREINRMFREDPRSLAAYNLLDAQLTMNIFTRTGILPNAVERTKRSGRLLDHPGGSIAAFDYLYLPRLHRAGYVAPDAADVRPPAAPLSGGLVIEPKAGLYENVLAFDFRSLYPSLIMTFRIDPLGFHAPSAERISGPVGPSFAVEPSILPSIIADLMEARTRAKQEKNPYLSQSIKILMNSFYGVLGAEGCRFFSAEIASTITGIGRVILRRTIDHIASVSGHPVIYGDTDSLFLCLGAGAESGAASRGPAIAAEANEWLAAMVKKEFNADSALRLQFECHFRHFFLPPLRGSTLGSKKHYCGSTIDANNAMTLHFKGMESARSDWTDLAKEFQHELFIRFFNGLPLDGYILKTVERVRSGSADHLLIYKKRLRKTLAGYTDHLPPHAQAARLLPKPERLIRYYITLDGPQPVEFRNAPIDYDHYVECQLKPVADSLLEATGNGFDRIVSGQQELFQ